MAIENENKLNEVIKAFADAGFIDDVVLIGSWCLGFYAEIFEGFTPSVRTTDIDFMSLTARGLTRPLYAANFERSTMTISKTA